MKIYFIQSTTGDFENVDEEVIGLLSEFGEVLVNDSFDVDPGYAYERAVDAIQEAEVIVAEVSAPNTSAGYSIGLAESLEKRILCLYRKGSDESSLPMITGNRKLSVAEYETVEDIEGVLRDFF